MPITHTFVNAKADGADATVTRPSDWNAAHVIELDYAQSASSLTVTATSAATAQTAITGNAVTYDGATAVWVEFSCYTLNKGTTNIYVLLNEGSTNLGILCTSSTVTGSPGYGRFKLTPTNGSHTYLIKAYVDAGTGTIGASNAGSDNYVPMVMTIKKV